MKRRSSLRIRTFQRQSKTTEFVFQRGPDLVATGGSGFSKTPLLSVILALSGLLLHFFAGLRLTLFTRARLSVNGGRQNSEISNWWGGWQQTTEVDIQVFPLLRRSAC